MNGHGISRTVAPAASPAAPRTRRLRYLIIMLALVLATLWAAWHPLLVAMGELIVAEDALEPVDAIVFSTAAARGDALEAAQLYHDGISRRLVYAAWAYDPLDDELHRLGVPYLDVTALARSILEHAGAPAAAITVLPGPVAGTEDEVATTVDFVRAEGIRSVLFIAPRTHSARVRWLLRRRLPATTRLLVRSARLDRFTADGWWRSRDQSRDVMAEYLRWVNSVLLGDAWRPAAPARVVGE